MVGTSNLQKQEGESGPQGGTVRKPYAHSEIKK